MTEPVERTARIEYADVVPRASAFLVDSLIIAVPYNLVFSNVLYAALGGLGLLAPFVIAVIVAALSAAYFVYFWTERGATPGMRLLGLALTEETGAGRLTTPQAVTRFLYLGLPNAIAVVFAGLTGFALSLSPAVGLGALGLVALLLLVASVAWLAYLAYTANRDPRHQGLHDRAAGSVVVAAR